MTSRSISKWIGCILCVWSIGAHAKELHQAAPKPSSLHKRPRPGYDRYGRPDLGYGPPSGELDLPDALWSGAKERYWRDRTPEGHVILQRLLAKANAPLPPSAQQSCAAWFDAPPKDQSVATLLYAHLFGNAPRAASAPSRMDHSCTPGSSRSQWSCRFDRFAKTSDTVPTASLHVDILADHHILLLNTLHCSVSHAHNI